MARKSANSVSLKRTPLHPCHVEHGARLVNFAGWEMPVQYTSVIEEHRAVRQAAGLFDVSHMGELHVSGGAQALAFLQWLTPNDLSKLTPGRAQYTALLTEEGTYVDDVVLYCLAEDEFLLVVNASNIEGDLEWITSRLPGGVRVEDRSRSTALLALQGPRAEAILAQLTAIDLRQVKYYRFNQGEVDGVPALVSRTGYTGEDGFELYLASETAPRLWRRLLEVGAREGLQPAGLGARDTLRLEAGMALYGQDIDQTTTPLEVGLGRLVKFDKGDFLGRQALIDQRTQGVKRKLVGFEVKGRGIARHGHRVVQDGQERGVVTSGTFSPTFERALGMALVPLEMSTPGQELELDVRGRLIDAVVCKLPFYRRPK